MKLHRMDHLAFWEEDCPRDTFERWCGQKETWKREIGSVISTMKLKSVLDIGCGTGIMKHIIDDEPNQVERYLGLEITPSFVDSCNEEGIPAQLGDIRNLQSFKDREFDCVLCLDVLNHQKEDPRPLLDEMLRVTNKLLVISFFKQFLNKHEEPRVEYKHHNMIYAFWPQELLTDHLERPYYGPPVSRGISWRFLSRPCDPGKMPKPPTLFIMRETV